MMMMMAIAIFALTILTGRGLCVDIYVCVCVFARGCCVCCGYCVWSVVVLVVAIVVEIVGSGGSAVLNCRVW